MPSSKRNEFWRSILKPFHCCYINLTSPVIPDARSRSASSTVAVATASSLQITTSLLAEPDVNSLFLLAMPTQAYSSRCKFINLIF